MLAVMSGQDLIDAGMSQGKWFRPALDAANAVLSKGGSVADALEAARLPAGADACLEGG
ncbi:hypothetical protein ACVMH6_000668 [Rhizobium leguminosarum]